MGLMKCAYVAMLLFLFVACLCETSIDAYAFPRRLLAQEGNAAAVTRTHHVVSTLNAGHIDALPPNIDTKDKVEEGTKATRSSTDQLQGKNCGGDHVECKQESGANSDEGVDNSGFVAFTKDYHPPRHHPPKNN